MAAYHLEEFALQKNRKQMGTELLDGRISHNGLRHDLFQHRRIVAFPRLRQKFSPSSLGQMVQANARAIRPMRNNRVQIADDDSIGLPTAGEIFLKSELATEI